MVAVWVVVFPTLSVAIAVIVCEPALSVPVAYVPPMQDVVAPLSTRQVTVLRARLSVAVIVSDWLAVELVGEVCPLIVTVGAVWSTRIVAVCVVALPLVSVAITVIVCDPLLSAPVA